MKKVLLIHDSFAGKLVAFDILVKEDFPLNNSLKELKDLMYSPDCLWVELFKENFEGYKPICSEDFAHYGQVSNFNGPDKEVGELLKDGFIPVYITTDEISILENYGLDIVRNINEYNGNIPVKEKLKTPKESEILKKLKKIISDWRGKNNV